MAEVYFYGDGHINHRNICKFRPQFSSVEEHNNTIIQNHKNVVTKRDKTFFTGDWVFDMDSLDIIAQMRGVKHLVMGNHDILTPELWKVFDFVSGPVKYKEFWVTHIPVHPEELRGKFNIHGHVHGNPIKDNPMYINTSMECIDYRPISLQQIRKMIYGSSTGES